MKARNKIGVLLAVIVAVLGLAITPAQAAPVAPAAACAPSACFALYCDWPSGNARPRVDLTNVFIEQGGAKVDADDIWYRSTRSSTGLPVTGWGVDLVLIQLYDSTAGQWVNWTSRGPTTSSSFHWDPSSKFNVAATYHAIRAYFRSAGGQTCYSAARAD